MRAASESSEGRRPQAEADFKADVVSRRRHRPQEDEADGHNDDDGKLKRRRVNVRVAQSADQHEAQYSEVHQQPLR